MTSGSAQTLSALQSAHGAVEDGVSRLAGVNPSVPYNSAVTSCGVDVPGIYQAITTAVGIPAMPGSVAQVHQIAQEFQNSATQLSTAGAAVRTAQTEQLPASWSGPAWQSASGVLGAVQTELTNAGSGLESIVTALNNYANTLNTVLTQDAGGCAALKAVPAQYRAIAVVNSSATIGQFTALLNTAANALNTRVQAWTGLNSAATTFVGLLDQYAATDARAGRMSGSTIDADTAVQLAVAQDGGSAGLNLPTTGAGANILNANALSLASQRLAAMSTADQATFQNLLNACRSPQQAAYLWKALSCGYPIRTLTAFDQAIAAHGTDLDWLAQHLDINLGTSESSTAPNGTNLSYQGQQIFSQGSINDCVAASTVMAAVQNDPVLSLFLTTGAPDPQFASLMNSLKVKPGDDSPQAVQTRLQAVFQQEYNWGLANDGPDSVESWGPIKGVINMFGSGPGIGEWGQHNLANNLLGTMNGASYTFVKMNNAADRAAALQQIDASVDAGVPVTFVVRAQGISNTFNRHQMAIIGSDASTGMLEVYNPWGETEWISKQDFVNGNLSALTGGQDGGMGLPYNIEIPTSTSP
jgi:uncharacterized protein YukE